MRLILLAALCTGLSCGAAAQPAASAIAAADLAAVRAGLDVGFLQQTVISFPGPDAVLDFVTIQPRGPALGDGFVVTLSTFRYSESCAGGNCNQAAFTLAARIVLDGLTPIPIANLRVLNPTGK